MTRSQERINDLLARGGGVIVVREVPSLRRTLYRQVAAGALVPVLRGVLIATGSRSDPVVLARAVCSSHPQAVVTGRVAAHLSYWRGAARLPVEVRNLRLRPEPAWLRTSRSRVHVELLRTVEGIRITAPELTALDLAEDTHGESIFALLRQYPNALEGLRCVLTLMPRRRGNKARAAALRLAANNPWSGGEQTFQAFLRSEELQEFEGNVAVRAGGRRVFPDLALRRLKIAIEFDSIAFHTDRESFEKDRWKHNTLEAAGWRVLHVTWMMLTRSPDEVLQWIRAVIALAERGEGGVTR